MESSRIRNFHLESELFFPIRALCERLTGRNWPSCEELNRLAGPLHNANGLPVQFVEDCGDPLGYEQRIYLRGEVETRANSWHDLFNALVWMTFPKAKSRLNLLHFEEICNQPDKRRSRMRDIATLFDESGVIIASSSETLSGMLQAFEWKRLFWENRAKVIDEMRCYIFGHGLYEKGISPFIGLTGHAILFPVDQSFFGWPIGKQLAHLDERFESQFSEIASTRDFSPLPLLGVPGWTAENENAAYYDNQSYFRRGRTFRNASD